MYRIGVDIGGTKINIGIFKDKELICSDKIAVKDIENLPLSVKEKICELCHNHGIDYEKLATCGVGIPGTVSDDGKRIIKVPNIAILSEDTAGVLENQLGIPVKLVQDSRAAAWGEYLCGAAVGAKGAVLLDEYGKDHYMPALDGKVVNTVGSGDSMVAGFIAGYEKMHDYDYALKLGTASGSATACSEGLADADMINQFMKK